MVVYTRSAKLGIVAYSLTATGAEQLWTQPFHDRGASPVVHDGHVYAIGGRKTPRAVCVELATGKIAWEETVAQTEISSPIIADGKIWYPFGSSLHCWRPTPERYDLLGTAKIPIVTATSPAIADGRIYLRLNDGVGCYDLRR
jgi:hypothetical protein